VAQSPTSTLSTAETRTNLALAAMVLAELQLSVLQQKIVPYVPDELEPAPFGQKVAAEPKSHALVVTPDTVYFFFFFNKQNDRFNKASRTDIY
jgi:hypothetical protein